ncbi:paraquat-inducible protein B [Pseudomonas aeruginosa PAK]|uniref:PqiB family protein n=1 Tax=Pseudomonas aeruginosa TaxID=287 RepID=UPI00033B80EB|nr:MlaD family protein [Pseudomonas aeruginosa]EOT15247.1 paraquat-inducible protein B [Pseudomonas aeruginosa PAK]
MSDLPSPKKHKTSNWSAIWVLPLVALAIGAWLGWRAYDQAGVLIQVRFESSDGIQAKKTEVLYKGIAVGKVVALDVSEDIKGVVATIEMDKEARQYLSKGTRFWLVKPRVSLAGVTGLETLVSGVYIAVDPVKGEKEERNFTALKQPPPLSDRLPGLHLTLKADRLGSLEQGSPVFYRQIQVGQVKSFQLGDDQRTIEIKVHIEPEYAHLVNTSTRFWNSSGITLTGNLSGVQVKSESLQTLITGGISFDTLDPKAPTVTKVRRFTLFDSEEAAMARGVEIQLSIDNADGLREGTPIRFKGLDIGKIESIELNPDLSGVLMKARLTSAGERVARSGTRFWVVRPALGLLRTENLGTLVSGPYIEALPSSTPGERQARFQTLAEAPNLLGRENGLRLTLSAPRKGSIKPGNLVTYRQIPVGKVVDLALGEQADRVLISILIEPRYVPLVRTGSRFWNASGFGVDASLFKGLSLRTESMEALMEGGIAFATPNNAQMGEPAKPGQTFALFDSANDEWLEWAPRIALRSGAR